MVSSSSKIEELFLLINNRGIIILSTLIFMYHISDMGCKVLKNINKYYK